MKRVHRCLGTTGVPLEVACSDRMATVVGHAQEVVRTWDWTDPESQYGPFQTLRINLRAHGRPRPIL